MREHGVEEDLTQRFTQYLQHCVCKVSGQEGHYRIRNSTGQGEVLSPVVWNYTMDSFLSEFNSGQFKAIGYADNGALVVVCRELATARKLMQAALRKAFLLGPDKLGSNSQRPRPQRSSSASTKLSSLPPYPRRGQYQS
jgi:hypothetical protein